MYTARQRQLEGYNFALIGHSNEYYYELSLGGNGFKTDYVPQGMCSEIVSVKEVEETNEV